MGSTGTVTPINKTTSSNGSSDMENSSKKRTTKANKAINTRHVSDKDMDFIQKLKCTVEKLHLENADLRKALDGERSAIRALRSQHELMWRNEKSLFRKREEYLESQIKELQRNTEITLNAIAQERPSPGESDLVRLNAQVQSLKRANKDINEKLQNATEAEKRTVAELRARDDARAAELSNAARAARTQTVQLLEELKTKDRLIDQLKKGCKKVSDLPTADSRQNAPKNKETDADKMSEIDRLQSLEAEINRLECELQQRNCIIDELKSAKTLEKHNINTQERTTMANRHRKELFMRDTISDVDSALSSGPNSLSPQPAPDFWDTHNNEMELETAKKQIKELQKLLNESSHETGTALSRLARADAEATRLRDALRDARDHADLLEFRLLEMDDSAVDKQLGDTLQCIREAISDADSGCVSPGNRINDSASPEFNRGDSGFKSPIFRQNIDTRILSTPTLKCNSLDGHHSTEDLTDASSKSLRFDDLKHRLEIMLLGISNEDDKNCIEQILSLLWDLQTLNTSIKEDYFIKTTAPKLPEKCDKSDSLRDIEFQTRSSKIIATISPYSQKSIYKEDEIQTDTIPKIKPEIESSSETYDTIKYTKILQESGIFEDINYDSKETQTDFPETCGGETSGDLTAEIERLNVIREHLERSGAIINANLINTDFCKDALPDNTRFILSHNHKKFYERRLKLLEEKVSFYESTKDKRDIKLAEIYHRESILESQIDDLNSQIDKLQNKYASLEEECCELDEAENDTRLHCQQLEIDYELVTAQLRDMEEQRDSAKEQLTNMELTICDFEETNIGLLEQEHELRERLAIMEAAMPALIIWNVFKIIQANPKFNFKMALIEKLRVSPLSREQHNLGILPSINCSDQNNTMLACKGMPDSSSTGDTEGLKPHLQQLLEEHKIVNVEHQRTEECLRRQITELERMLQESSYAAQKLREETEKSGLLEQQVRFLKEKASNPLNQELKQTEEGQTFDNECMLRLQQLIQSENELKNRIRMLEHRDMAYLETLSQADDLWAEMESGYKMQIKDKHEAEETLKEELKQCLCDKEKWKNQSDHLKLRIRELEEEETRLQEQLKDTLSHVQRLSEQNENYKMKVDDLASEINAITTKSALETHNIQAELDSARKKSQLLTEELAEFRRQSKELEEQLKSEISEAQKEITVTCKHLVELDLTNSELREEVETLEKQVVELNDVIKQQGASLEDQVRSLSLELKSKSTELEELIMKQNNSALNTLQELGMASIHGELSTVDIAQFDDQITPENYCSSKQPRLSIKPAMIAENDLPVEKKFQPCIHTSVQNKLIEELPTEMLDKSFNTVEDRCVDSELQDVNKEGFLSSDEIFTIKRQLGQTLTKIMEYEIHSRGSAEVIKPSVNRIIDVSDMPNNLTPGRDSKTFCWKPSPIIKVLHDQDPEAKKS